MNFFERLPNELVEYILSFIGEHRSISSLVCILWNTIIKNKCISTNNFTTLSLVIWAKDNFRYYYPRKIFLNAARIGNLEIIIYLYEMYKLYILKDSESCMNAIKNNHTNVLRWLLSHGFECNEDIISYVALYGEFELLKWIHSTIYTTKSIPWIEKISTCATKSGNLEMLKYLHENGCPWDKYTCSRAAEYEYLEILKYLHENGCPWDEDTCSYAAEYGYFELLKYAHENGCPWSVATFAGGIISENLEILEYLRENGCPWDKISCHIAAEYGYLEILKWLRDPDRPGGACPWDEYVRIKAIQNGHTKVIEWLSMQNLPIITR